MLKRQRQSSPLPPSSSSSIPFVSDGPSDLIERTTKRRRTQPPVMDGTQRGWNSPSNNNSAFRDDEDDYISEDDEPADSAHSAQPFDLQYQHYQQNQSEYKSANTLLRELHTLNQHRLLFSSASSPVHSSATPSHATHPSAWDTVQQPLQHPESYLNKTPLLPLERISPFDKRAGPGANELSPKEAEFVTERYEQTNRLLGSLFLSRRRKLDPLEDAAR
ncbi:hypothetical protein CPC08DRAFT_764298 [Agrocybe pediades]|nr:hypothetical protein CPC08DRAFT_764298 [Agrocybe pediades]